MRKLDLNIYNQLTQNEVHFTPEINVQNITDWGQNLENIYNHYDSYLLNFDEVNSIGCLEKHPYLNIYEDDYDLSRGTLILGTFPPSSYFNNLPLVNLPNPNIQPNQPVNYFYGNLNELWYFLFGLNPIDLTVENIRTLLAQNNISISDVIKYAQRKVMKNSDDKNLKNIVINCSLSKVFNKDSNVHTILFTSGSLSSFLGSSTSALTGFRWILEDCCGGLESFQINGNLDGNGDYYQINQIGIQHAIDQQNGGILWWLRNKNKKLRIINLPSPSRAASRQMQNSTFFLKWINFMAITNGINPPHLNQNLDEYLLQYPNVFQNSITRQYRRMIYEMVLNNTIEEII